MNTGHRATPSWGAFKGSTQAEASGGSADAGFYGVSVPVRMIDAPAEESSPAFDVHASLQNEGVHDVSLDRNEEEFDELGEGALRQIGRNFASIVGAGSAVAMLGAFVFWAMPSQNPGGAEVAEVVAAEEAPTEVAEVAEKPEVAQVALKQEFYVGNSDMDIAPAEQDPVQFVEIKVELPVPVIVEQKEAPVEAERKLVFDTSGFPGPIPIVREYAMNALAQTQDGVIAQGSDDDWNASIESPATEMVAAREWVSVMIPKSRPEF